MTISEPATAKGRTTRARIIQAAAELVAERGAATVSLDEVGARAHASRSQLYHYFEDRDDLIRAVIDATTNAVLAAQDELLADLDSWAGIDRWFAALEAIQRKREGPRRMSDRVTRRAARRARPAGASRVSRWLRSVGVAPAGGTRTDARSGYLAPDTAPSQLATATMALLQGGLLLAQVRRDPDQLHIALDAARSLLRTAST